MKATQPHDETVVEMFKADAEMADVYLATALEEAHLPGGQFALLAALRHIAEAQGMATVVVEAGMALWMQESSRLQAGEDVNFPFRRFRV